MNESDIAIREMIIQKELAIERLDLNISRLWQLRAQEIDRIHAEKETYALIHQLPDELLICIFRLRFRYVRGRLRVDPRKAPLVLLGVCSRWRRILFSMTGIWSSLDIHDGMQSTMPCPRMLARCLRVAQMEPNSAVSLSITSSVLKDVGQMPFRIWTIFCQVCSTLELKALKQWHTTWVRAQGCNSHIE